MAWRPVALLWTLLILAVEASSHRRLLFREPSLRQLLADEQVDEQKALLSLKQAFNPDDAAAKLASWNSGTDHCTGWQGVYCTSEKRVYFVDLARQGLRGTLNDAVDLSPLAYMQILWLQENRLAGSLPPAMFTGLDRLHELMLYDNELEGSLPAGLAVTSKLKRLYLNGNRLSGSLPPEWSSMAQMEELGLASNSLEGTVPEAYGNWSKLKVFSIHNNPKIVGCLPSTWNGKQPPVRLVEDERHAADGGGLNPALVFTELCGFCSETCENPVPPVPSPSPVPPSPSPQPAVWSPSPEPGISSNGSNNGSSSPELPNPSPDPSIGSNSNDTAGGPTQEGGATSAAEGSNAAADAASNGTAVTVDPAGLGSGTAEGVSDASQGMIGDAFGTTVGPVTSPSDQAVPAGGVGMPTFSPSTPKRVDNPDDLVIADNRKSVFMSVEPSSSNSSADVGRKRM